MLRINYKLLLLLIPFNISNAATEVIVDDTRYVLKAGHSSLQTWLIPETITSPEGNPLSNSKIELGQRLFFETALSKNNQLSCATCHNPALGWSDGLATARGFNNKTLPRATPTIINSTFNLLQNWDGRNNNLEAQATEPVTHPDEMHMDMKTLIDWLEQSDLYRVQFMHAFPSEEINAKTIAKAIASFERTVISNNSPFDRWVKGDATALSKTQIQGFEIFLDPKKGNCATCHAPPNFTDSSFHNIGLQSYLNKDPDLGRYKHLPLPSMKGAFKTPTLRHIDQTSPYFHDGSANTLKEVVEHYKKGGIHNPDLSHEMKPLDLTNNEIDALVDFMSTLTGKVYFGTINSQNKNSTLHSIGANH